MDFAVRKADQADFDAIWDILSRVVALGRSIQYEADDSRETVMANWTGPGSDAYVVFDQSAGRGAPIAGAFFIRPNCRGRGSHIANCGYTIEDEAYTGGILATIGRNVFDAARDRGFEAIMLNYVASTNSVAIAFWQSCGFKIIGTIPGAFQDAKLGFVDVYIMHRGV